MLLIVSSCSNLQTSLSLYFESYSLAVLHCLQMEPLFNESKDRMMVKIADLADKGELADLSKYVRCFCIIASKVLTQSELAANCFLQSVNNPFLHA